MRIAVLLSGGVDSSVALRLLHEQGHEIEAFYLKIWLEDELAYLGTCPWEEDLAYAQAVCDRVGVPLHVVPLQKEYWEHVVAYTIAEVQAGRTPSPDLLCNQRIKFGCFLDYLDARSYIFDKIATGHYAQVEQRGNQFLLKKAHDTFKDQTYFLAYLNQVQLSRLIFPVGSYLKSEVRALAERFDLPNKQRKDSQGICFLGKIKFADFVAHHLGKKTGDLIEHETGKKLGEHDGFWFYTLGQRKGLRLGGGPWFVVKKNPVTNEVFISSHYHEADLPDKMRDNFYVESVHWISDPPTQHNLEVKVRHGEHLYRAVCKLQGDKGHVALDSKDQGLAPGQFAVFYDGDVCLGCGVLAEKGFDEGQT